MNKYKINVERRLLMAKNFWKLGETSSSTPNKWTNVMWSGVDEWQNNEIRLFLYEKRSMT